MQSSKSNRHTVPAVTFSEDFLPGFDPLEGDAESPGHPPPTSPRTGWRVKRSAKQVTNSAGMPAGYRHQLMQGGKVMASGVGADCARTFRKQADFLNSHGACISRNY